MNMIMIPTAIIDTASRSFFNLSSSTNRSPQRPEKRAVIPIINQRMFLASCLTESMTLGSFGSAFEFLPKMRDLLIISFLSPTIPV